MRKRSAALIALVIVPALIGARPLSPSAHRAGASDARQLAREIFKELIEINTTDSTGDTTKAADAMAARLIAAGLPPADVRVLGPHPRKGNLVARLRGTGARRPLLLLAHTDVVEARREDWSSDPFKLMEKDGFLRE
jgi:acetylornithine deacetylase/succinyl-diaminopimelate desuccinylase-like protein